MNWRANIMKREKIMGEKDITSTRERLDKFMAEAAKEIKTWPEWKQNIRIMDCYRQYDRYEPKQGEQKNMEKKKMSINVFEWYERVKK